MICQLKHDPETNNIYSGEDALCCGYPVEVLIVQLDGTPVWKQSRLEIDENGWYLVGLRDYQINGLFARL